MLIFVYLFSLGYFDFLVLLLYFVVMHFMLSIKHFWIVILMKCTIFKFVAPQLWGKCEAKLLIWKKKKTLTFWFDKWLKNSIDKQTWHKFTKLCRIINKTSFLTLKLIFTQRFLSKHLWWQTNVIRASNMELISKLRITQSEREMQTHLHEFMLSKQKRKREKKGQTESLRDFPVSGVKQSEFIF